MTQFSCQTNPGISFSSVLFMRGHGLLASFRPDFPAGIHKEDQILSDELTEVANTEDQKSCEEQNSKLPESALFSASVMICPHRQLDGTEDHYGNTLLDMSKHVS